LENSHKNSTLSYRNFQECEGRGNKRIKKNTRNGRRAETMKPNELQVTETKLKHMWAMYVLKEAGPQNI
jgi:hypothetical protein